MVCVVVWGTCMNLAEVPMQVADPLSTPFSAYSVYQEILPLGLALERIPPTS